MRITVTPLGASGAGAGRVAKRIVAYLEGKQPSPARQLLGSSPAKGASGVVGYYSDSMEGAGRWHGTGAAALGLTGDVAAEDLESVLAGRDPRTGLRLVGASGSAQRGQLRSGSAARYGKEGRAWFEVRDVAVLLGVTKAQVIAMLNQGDQGGADHPGVANWLDGTTTSDGIRLVPDSEVRRWLDLTGAGVTAASITASGEPGDQLTTSEAAAILGVSPSYVQRLCKRHIEAGHDPTATRDGTWIRCQRQRNKGSSRYVIRRSDLADYAERRRPATARVGFDLTLTTEKSFGIAMMLCSPQAQPGFQEAIDNANQTAISYLEANAAFTRHKGKRVKAGGLIAASYLHGTSRALDPFPHRHNVVANATVDANGDRKTLDARALYEHAPAAAALATAQMRWLLTDRFGVGWRRSRRGVWEIDGLSDDLLDDFSQRRNRIELASEELAVILGRPVTKREERKLVVETRQRKTPTTVAELLTGWWERANRHGLDRNTLDAILNGTRRPTVWTEALRDWVIGELAGPDGMTADLGWFTRPDVICRLVGLTLPDEFGGGPLLLPAADIEAVADLFLTSLDIVEVDLPATASRLGSTEAAFTTVELLETQSRIRSTYLAGVDDGTGIAPADLIEAAIAESAARGVTLRADQEDLVRDVCGSGMRFQCAIGPPGSGKTAAMRVAAQAWQEAGWDVIGASVKGEAARLLAEATGIETNTLAWYLTAARAGYQPFGANTIVIVDESSTIADRDLDLLLTLAANAGATLRLIGDPAQHGSVGAGGSWAALTRLRPDHTPVLTANRRLRDREERRVAHLVRNGQITDALAVMATNGQLHAAVDEHEAMIGLLARWWEGRQSGHAHPMVDRLNHTRQELNRLARQLRIEAGELDPATERTIGVATFAEGDEVIARSPARWLHPAGQPDRYVRNGSTGTIAAVHADRLTVHFDSLGDVDVPDRYVRGDDAPGLDLAYAVTSYAVQGATFDRSSSLLTPQSSRAELYVNITRGRDENHVFATESEQPRDDQPHLPRLPPPPLLEAIEHGVQRKAGETSIIDLDPAALQVARVRRLLSGGEAAQPGDFDDTSPVVLARAVDSEHRSCERQAGIPSRISGPGVPGFVYDVLVRPGQRQPTSGLGL